MKELYKLIITSAIIMMAITIIIVPAAAAEYSPDKVIIKYIAPDGSGDTSALTNGQIHAEIISSYTLVPGLYTLKLPLDVSVEQAIVYYGNISGVEYVEPDYYASIIQTPTEIIPETKTDMPSPSSTASPFGFIGLMLGVLVSMAVVVRNR